MSKLLTCVMITVVTLLSGCASTSDGSGGTTLAGELSSKGINFNNTEFTWRTDKRRIITEFEYESPTTLQDKENKLAEAEVRKANKTPYKNGLLKIVIYSNSINSVSNGNAKALIVQDGQNLVSRSVDGVANIPDSTKQWWNLVSLPLDAIDLSKEFELRVMYSFDSNYTSFIFSPKKQ